LITHRFAWNVGVHYVGESGGYRGPLRLITSCSTALVLLLLPLLLVVIHHRVVLAFFTPLASSGCVTSG